MNNKEIMRLLELEALESYWLDVQGDDNEFQDSEQGRELLELESKLRAETDRNALARFRFSRDALKG